ncbi:uncharacterized protein K452DRAFT_311400 [Aplosporella prunicola CBS 121167]|uniref:Inhibitor of growth protein N-terminal histone-binding domain-containing protein n=1 Tax=Aplosporella prunicola CBS 121167 TaxID=1176127 RepID=A0A6A6B3R1_9PEZI|nr:uncharacterized protein K452DRAFT_311400 [Aplosporella prunicola CBS 121167]KAF2138456.1 hypothetical protein K452DRAFT_311400 [Aplosporella prunicola CBS 121167]
MTFAILFFQFILRHGVPPPTKKGSCLPARAVLLVPEHNVPSLTQGWLSQPLHSDVTGSRPLLRFTPSGDLCRLPTRVVAALQLTRPCTMAEKDHWNKKVRKEYVQKALRVVQPQPEYPSEKALHDYVHEVLSNSEKFPLPSFAAFTRESILNVLTVDVQRRLVASSQTRVTAAPMTIGSVKEEEKVMNTAPQQVRPELEREQIKCAEALKLISSAQQLLDDALKILQSCSTQPHEEVHSKRHDTVNSKQANSADKYHSTPTSILPETSTSTNQDFHIKDYDPTVSKSGAGIHKQSNAGSRAGSHASIHSLGKKRKQDAVMDTGDKSAITTVKKGPSSPVDLLQPRKKSRPHKKKQFIKKEAEQQSNESTQLRAQLPILVSIPKMAGDVSVYCSDAHHDIQSTTTLPKSLYNSKASSGRLVNL